MQKNAKLTPQSRAAIVRRVLDQGQPRRGGQRLDRVLQHPRIPVVLETLRRPLAHAGARLHGAQQQRPRVGRDRPAIEAGDQPPAADPRTFQLTWRTLCRQGATSMHGVK